MHSARLELTKLTYTRLEDSLVRHRGDRLSYIVATIAVLCYGWPGTKDLSRAWKGNLATKACRRYGYDDDYQEQ